MEVFQAYQRKIYLLPVLSFSRRWSQCSENWSGIGMPARKLLFRLLDSARWSEDQMMDLILADLDTPAGKVENLGRGHLGHLNHLGGGRLRHPLRQEGFHLQRVKGQRVRWRRVKKSLKVKNCFSKDHLAQIWNMKPLLIIWQARTWSTMIVYYNGWILKRIVKRPVSRKDQGQEISFA